MSDARGPDLIMAPPDAEEMEGRLARVRARMAAAELDAYVCHCPDNVYYLTHFANYIHERPFVLVIAPTGPIRFVVPHLEEAHVRARSVGDVDTCRYAEFPAPAGGEWADVLRAALGQAKRVGVESICPLQVYEAIDAERVRLDVVDEARFVKTPYEIGRIAHASSVVSEGHAQLLEGVGFGDVSRAMTFRMYREVPNPNHLACSFAAVAQPPSISHDPHNFTGAALKEEEGGPHVTIVNCRVNGYGAEVERTYFVNIVPDLARERFDVMLEARQIAFDLLRPGVSMSSVDQATRDCFEKHGYLDHVLHRTGHSFGVTGHEAPFLAIGYDRVVEPGMLFSIEPGIYFEGIGGFRFSDTVLVTDEGNVSLTHAPETLEELTLAR